MTETEVNSSRVPFITLPPPPPLPDFLFSKNPVQCAKSDVEDDEIESLEKAIRQVTDVDRFLNAKPFHSHYTHLQSQLQEGPKCGLVALSMATSKTDCFKSVDELYAEALNQGYTTQGEMYSCHNLADLVQRTTKFKTLVIENGIDSHLECIFHCIQNGGLMLVPFS